MAARRSRLRGRGAGGGQLELGRGRGGDLLADVPRLVEVPVIELVGLRLLHGLDDVVVLDLADAQEGGQQRDGDRDARVEAHPCAIARSHESCLQCSVAAAHPGSTSIYPTRCARR